MNNEKAVVNSDEIITSFGNKMKSVDEQFNTITNKKVYLLNYKYMAYNNDWTNALKQALLDAEGGELYFPNEKITVTETIIIPPKTKLFGINNKDIWDSFDNTGTIITTSGVGNPQIWTDINDGDDEPITPLFVYGGNEIELENISFECNNNSRWDCALFLPCVKRPKFKNVYTYGNWKKGGLYLDATWSDKNEYLKNLHPYISPSSGMNELNAYDCYFRGKWGLLIQGTQRDTNNFTEDTFIWGYGGTSDLNFYGCRFGCDGLESEKKLDGGCYKSDAAIKNGIGVGIGHNFFGCSFRTESKYMIYLDRSGRDNFISCYGETINHWLNAGNEHAQFFITGNTYQITRVADRIIAPVYRHSTKLSEVGKMPTYASNCRMTILGIDGELNTPNLKGGGIYDTTNALELKSLYDVDGIIGAILFMNKSGIFADIRSDRFNLRDIPYIKSNNGYKHSVANKDVLEFTSTILKSYVHNAPYVTDLLDNGTSNFRWRTNYCNSVNVTEGIRFNATNSSDVSTRTLFLDISDMQLKYKDHDGNIRLVTSQAIQS